MGRGKDPEKHRYWAAQLQAWQDSGLTQTEFCRQHGIRRRLLSFWKRRLAESSSEREPAVARLVPVALRPEPVAKGAAAVPSPAALTVVTGTGYRVEVGDGFAPPTLARLLVTLEHL